MKKLVLFTMLFISVLVVSAAGPKLMKVTVSPDKVKVGEKISFVLEYSGKTEEIQTVKLFSKEYPYDAPVIELVKKEGAANLWIGGGDVPYDAPSGIYNWEVKTIDQKGEEIVNKEYAANMYGKSGGLKFEIVY